MLIPLLALSIVKYKHSHFLQTISRNSLLITKIVSYFLQKKENFIFTFLLFIPTFLILIFTYHVIKPSDR